MKRSFKIFTAFTVAISISCLSGVSVGADQQIHVKHYDDFDLTPEEMHSQAEELHDYIQSYASENGLDLTADSYAYDIPVPNSSIEPMMNEPEVMITQLPMSAEYEEMTEEERAEYVRCLFEQIEGNNGVYEASPLTRDGNVPTQFYNLAVDCYTGDGTYTNSPLYTSYYFSCGASQNLTIEGWAGGIPKRLYNNLIITLCDSNGGTVECPIEPIWNGHETVYYYHFAIGPLNPNLFYYFKWSTVVRDEQHSVIFTISTE